MATDLISERSIDEPPLEALPKPPPDRSRVREMRARRPNRLSAPRACSRLNGCLDAVLLVHYLALVWVTATLNFVFPSGADAAGWTLWGGDVVFWRNVQFWVLCSMAVGILLRLTSHWPWMCRLFNTRVLHREYLPANGSAIPYGIGLILIVINLLAAGLLAARWFAERP